MYAHWMKVAFDITNYVHTQYSAKTCEAIAESVASHDWR